MDIYLTNTLTKTKELFQPITKGAVGMYHCGPTVYNNVQIGNLRAFLLADITRRVFEYNNYQVNQVMNITDVGHLVSDGDEGDDKMTKGLKREGLEVTLENMLTLARKYEDAFLQDITAMNILKPKTLPRASEHITEDIELIKNLEKNGFIYTTTDGIYFDTIKMPDYGKLGNIQGNQSRVENSDKKNPRDFALWKFDNEKGWESPWGKGFPGWHIECSGMSMKYLGEQFDIHTGGTDLASIHHNNEIAQSECATGHAPFVNYWLHNEFVNIGNEKMAKSAGNSITLQTIRDRNIDPLALRYLYLQSHYRSPISFSWDALEASQTALKKLKNSLNGDSGGTINEDYKEKFLRAVNDDLNTSAGLAITWELVKDKNINDADKKATLLNFDTVLGLKLAEREEIKIPNEVQQLINEREEARKNKDWQKADELREKIIAMGFEVQDK